MVTKPAGWVFTKLDAVWPEATVVGMEGPDGAKAELQEAYLLPWMKAEDAARMALARLVPGGKERRTRIGERPALAWESPEKAALAVPDGPQAWVFVVNGKNAGRIVDELATGWKLDGAVRPTSRTATGRRNRWLE